MSELTVTLNKPHRHAGRDYPPGAKLTLRKDKADWLISLGVAEPAAAVAAQPAPTTKRKE